MRASKIMPGTETDPVNDHTVSVPDSIWSALQKESARRAMSISDILVEAVCSRVVNVSPTSSPTERRRRRKK